MLTDAVRSAASDHGLSQFDHYALSVLMQGGPATIAEVNAILAGSGATWTDEDLETQVAAGFVSLDRGDKIALTRSGREIMIALFAKAKATEAHAQKAFDDEELDALRSLLSRLLEELGSRSEHGAAQHLEVMNALQADQS